MPPRSTETARSDAIIAYCLDNSLPFNEIVYRVKSGETIVSLSRKDLLTLL
ncbi:hypothetical protein LINGRAHAP2_LOCUS2267, partial [Linum grandiflorum]